MSSSTIATLAKLWLLTLILLVCMGVSGCTKRAKDAVSQEQRAIDTTLKGRAWYDAETMTYRPPQASAEFDNPVRIHGWEAPPPPANTPPPTARPWNWGWRSGFFDDGFAIVIWVILGAVLVGLLIWLAGSSMQTWSRASKLTKQAKAIVIDPTRVVDLPFEAKAEMQDPLEAARRMAAEGNYDGAVLFLYGYMLLALDRAGQIVLHRGKTNRMYLSELSSQQTLRELLRPAMLAFEDVFFGRHPTDQPRFMQLWNNLELFHNELEPIMKGRQQPVEPLPEVART